MADDPQVTTREQWLTARRELLAKEKALARDRDEVSAARRALPMVEISEGYSFDGPHGRASPLDLFDGRSQLLKALPCEEYQGKVQPMRCRRGAATTPS